MSTTKTYGSKGQEWHPDFIKYMEYIASHEAYQGMPDAIRVNGLIQWETPSNRPSGRYKESAGRRRYWWRMKAREVGIDPESDEWISRTAKRIHPTLQKPCKRCGRMHDLRYVYPNAYLLRRIRKLEYVGADFPLEPFEPLPELISRLANDYGDRVLMDLPHILKTSSITPPRSLTTVEDWREWIEQEYVPAEPALLSPGAYSNAPDRFDGFHSFNRCCRPEADKGRHPKNMATYVTDRRVFECWNDGDWIAADRLMGKIRADLGDQECANGHPGPCSADHIGPLSLGFSHRPEFRLLCKPCNSGKNNRLTLRDVQHLREVESRGEQIMSWHGRALWDARKESVVDRESAQRLSKLLRDNRHSVMEILGRIHSAGHLTFLTSLLQLDFADRSVGFNNLRVERNITRFDSLVVKNRQSTYAAKQKARRCRVAFEALRDYFADTSGNTFVVTTPEIEQAVSEAISILGTCPDEVKSLDSKIVRLLSPEQATAIDQGFRQLVGDIPSYQDIECFAAARSALEHAVRLAAEELSKMWTSDRYVRADADAELGI